MPAAISSSIGRSPRCRRVPILVGFVATLAVSGSLAVPAAQADRPPSTPGPATASGPVRSELQQALDGVVEAGALGAQVELVDRHRRWLGTSGQAELDSPRPVPVHGRFRIGSVTKTFTATVLLQLVAESKVDLDAPVERYLPGVVPNGENIPVRQLLNHTSGLFDYVHDAEVFPLTGKDFLTRVRFRTFSAEELVRVATSHSPLFPPGTGWWYSNTNYVLAGMIIEAVTNREYADEVERRIIRPLRLRHTDLPGRRTSIPGPHAHGYLTVTENGTARPVDITRLNPSWAGPAGEIISTTHDLNRFYSALLKGRLLPPAQLDAMLTTVPTGSAEFAYGLGIAGRRLPCGVTVWGHDGGIHGFATDSVHALDGDRHLSVSITVPDGFGPEEMYAAWEQVVCLAFG